MQICEITKFHSNQWELGLILPLLNIYFKGLAHLHKQTIFLQVILLFATK